MSSHPRFDFVGLGAGPANLSLAALSQRANGLSSCFFERSSEPQWHPGLLLRESLLQTSFLKDLVTPVDPTNAYSFLAYLVAHQRLYPFITASFPQVTRAEFCQYLAWAARSLPNVRLGCTVEAIAHQGDAWRVRTSEGTVLATDLVLGTGRVPAVPEAARPHLGASVFHAGEFRARAQGLKDKRVAVIGGGQSGAEIFHHLLLDSNALPKRLVWVSRRENFLPLDDSPFANEWFTPAYSEFFFELDEPQRARWAAAQRLASDGISEPLLRDIYRRLYELRFIERCDPRGFTLLPSHSLVGMDRTGDGYTLMMQSSVGGTRAELFDTVILATGYRWELPPCMQELKGRLQFAGGEPVVRADFSLAWDGPGATRIFVQNAARLQRGVADPNLSLLAWRSARILNQLARRELYDCTPANAMIDWHEHREQLTHV